MAERKKRTRSSAFFLHLDVAVADDAKGAAAEQSVAGEQGGDLAPDQRFDGDVAVLLPRQAHEARQGGGDHQQFLDRLAVRIALQVEDQREALVRDERKGVGGVDRLGGDDRVDILGEMPVEPGRLTRADLVEPSTETPAARSWSLSEAQTSCWLAVKRVGDARQSGQLLRGISPSVERSSTFSSCWPLRPATRTMKNSSRLLPEMDRKRSRSSSGCASLQASSRHAAVEGQPRQFAVEIKALRR
jgi:hypothetical protein